MPAVGVMTTKFVSAAELMARSQGAEDFRFVTIEHPISSATDAALAEQARIAVTQGLRILAGDADA